MSDGTPRIDQLLEAARNGLTRVSPRAAAAAIEVGALLVDIRPPEMRAERGEFVGALVVDRNVLEWRLDPTSPFRLSEIADPGRLVIVACQQGYASSLAAATLCELGVDATDLIGGFQAWEAAGLPIRRHLDPRQLDQEDNAPARLGSRADR